MEAHPSLYVSNIFLKFGSLETVGAQLKLSSIIAIAIILAIVGLSWRNDQLSKNTNTGVHEKMEVTSAALSTSRARTYI